MQYYLQEYRQNNMSKKKPVSITNWKLGRMIGHGSFGDVYEGIDL